MAAARKVLYPGVGSAAGNEPRRMELGAGGAKLLAGKTKNLAHRVLAVEALPLPVPHHYEEQVERECLVTQPVKVPAVEKFVVDYRVAACPSHAAGGTTTSTESGNSSCISRPAAILR